MAACSWFEWLQTGGSPGGNGDGSPVWDLKPIYRSLAAAYGWTYSEIDSHTLVEVNELFEGWDESPPTHLLLKAIVVGLGGSFEGKKPKGEQEIPSEVFSSMQASAVAGIAAKGGRSLPVIVGQDKGLPKASPIFDLEALKRKNKEAADKLKAQKTDV